VDTVTSMGLVMTAIALAAALVQLPAASPSGRLAAGSVPQTLYSSPTGTIQAFAQDGPLVAWFSPSTKSCNAVWVLSLDNGGRVRLPDETSTARTVPCRWDVAPPVNLALAGTDALWTLRERQATLPFDYVLGAGYTDPLERRFQEVAHTKRGAGLWLGGIAGDSVRTGAQTVSTLAYGTAAVQYVDEIGCLSGGSCQMKLAGGGVYRVVGRKPPTQIPNTHAALAVAVSGSTLADVQAAADAMQALAAPSRLRILTHLHSGPAAVGELAVAHVLRREAEVFAVCQNDLGLLAGLDHAIALVQRDGKRLVDEDVLAGLGCGDGDLGVEVVRAGDGDGVDEVAFEHVMVVGENVRHLPAAVELPDVVRVRGGGGDELRARRLRDPLSVRVGDES